MRHRQDMQEKQNSGKIESPNKIKKQTGTLPAEPHSNAEARNWSQAIDII